MKLILATSGSRSILRGLCSTRSVLAGASDLQKLSLKRKHCALCVPGELVTHSWREVAGLLVLPFLSNWTGIQGRLLRVGGRWKRQVCYPVDLPLPTFIFSYSELLRYHLKLHSSGESVWKPSDEMILSCYLALGLSNSVPRGKWCWLTAGKQSITARVFRLPFRCRTAHQTETRSRIICGPY